MTNKELVKQIDKVYYPHDEFDDFLTEETKQCAKIAIDFAIEHFNDILHHCPPSCSTESVKLKVHQLEKQKSEL